MGNDVMVCTNFRARYICLIICFFGLLLGSCSNSSGSEGGLPLIQNPEDTKAVLFVGNSLTNNNSMAEMARRMAATTERALLYEQHAPGGARIADHAGSGELDSKIASRKWNLVSIQGQSSELAVTESSLNTSIYPNIQLLVDKVKDNNAASIPLFYMSWGYKDGAPGLCDPIPETCTFEGMNGLIKDRYLQVMELSDGQVSPCAELWSVIRDRHPELELYASDGIHPSILGSYAVALSFYTMIFEADPTETTYHRTELDTADEQLLREAVKEVVFDRMSEWRAN